MMMHNFLIPKPPHIPQSPAIVPPQNLPREPNENVSLFELIACKDGWKLTALEWKHVMLKNTSACLVQEYTSHTGAFQSELQGSLTRYFLICSILPNWGLANCYLRQF